MKFIDPIALATLMAAQIQGAALPKPEKPEVTVCMDQNADPTIVRAQAFTSRIYGELGIPIQWNRRTPECTAARNTIVVNLVDRTPQAQSPGSLAVSAPFQGKDIVLYYDRVRAMGRGEPSTLLGYVLAHEIAHIAQGITRHSEEGILKSRWDGRDFSSMRHTTLRFTEEDIDLILRGLGAGHELPPRLQPGSTVAARRQ